MTVLIADDEPALLRILGFNFEKAGFTVLTAPDGSAAWTALKERRPDAAVLDAMMPGMSGPEVCKCVRADPSTAGIKVMILSAKGEEDVARLANECGADLYETKPFSAVGIVGRVRSLLEPSPPPA